ncbi:MAG: hypothetical protein KatS3mg035_0392 [Bacteroidia bacterium]|nr:MAG: hypothetical protein KatS3mg035_0392 [Bacteroidia bacterium]
MFYQNQHIENLKSKINKWMSGIAFLAMLLLTLNIHAQIHTAVAKIDTAKILIGEHIRLKVDVRYPAELKNNPAHTIIWPAYTDTITEKIEIVEQSEIDTSLSSDQKTVLLSKTYVITSFDSGFVVIPPLSFYNSLDTTRPFETQPLLIEVQTVAVDTTQEIKDIKEPIDVPFTFKELLPYFIGGLIAIIIILLIVLYFLKRKKKAPQIIEEVKIIEPAHVIALRKLEELNQKKLWQQGKNKEYHSEISDIVRWYIEERYQITALEQTTGEILLSIRSLALSNELREKLQQLLSLSDLVKFAKAQPLPQENELSMQNAIDFIQQTKAEELKEAIQEQEVQQ